ncbi:MAG: hypothetical protein M1828_007450, partial [Chrysothrix sp. TS-e1954]
LSLFPWNNEGQPLDINVKPSNDAEKQSAPNADSVEGEPAAAEVTEAKDASDQSKKATTSSKGRDYGSASRRWMRNRRPKDLPPIVLPAWFLERNVKLNEDAGLLIEGKLQLTRKEESVDVKTEPGQDSSGTLAESTRARVDSEEPGKVDGNGVGVDDATAGPSPDTATKQEAKASSIYRVNQAQMSEALSLISAGLSSYQPDAMESFPTGKSHLKLHCPVDGGMYFLEKIVEESASQLGADVIRLDAQDLADVTSDYIREGPEAKANSLWSLGYDSQQPSHRSSASAELEKNDSEAEDEGAMEEAEEGEGRPSMPSFHTVAAIPLDMSPRDGKPTDLASLLKHLASRRGGMPGGGPMGSGADPMSGYIQVQGPNGPAAWNDHKLSALLETLMEANHIKRLDTDSTATQTSSNTSQMIDSTQDTAENPAEAIPRPPTPEAETGTDSKVAVTEIMPRTIIMVRGLKELSTTRQGRLILEKLIAIAQKKRKEGLQFMLIGTTSSSELTPEISRAAIENLQGEDAESVFRTLVITPNEAGPAGGLFYAEERRRTREINIRNLHGMIRRLSNFSDKLIPADPNEFAPSMRFGGEQVEMSDLLEDGVLSFDEVHRIAIVAVGNKAVKERGSNQPERLQSHHLQSAIDILDESDEAKTEWARNEKQLQRSPEETQRANVSPNEARMKRLKKTANRHEKSLLKGIVNPEHIRTTFKDVHAPLETIEALKNLTTLSLLRPEAFKYGVLATDKLTGLLLYGPPGTGKTLLAKAVAKESGATVLEVSGSSLMDMYVGESEKNCRAVFSLAKKLSPCVVFIDEADAIFASRSSGSNRTSHRDMINEFLREWDGMSDSNTFIMLATNRPFDLDDAALRRLPRRLLVDLPTEKDREAILGIHLKEEQLEPSISLSQLAAQSPLYSGSDLKNVAVAAALAAVREENEAASKHQADSKEPYQYPERRTICQRHIDKALEEITASVSEDMSSLGAIRKFDDKYGDRRGRKKRSSYGFSTGEGVKEDTVKVRS